MTQMRPTLETIRPHLTSVELQKQLGVRAAEPGIVAAYMAYRDPAIQDAPKCAAMSCFHSVRSWKVERCVRLALSPPLHTPPWRPHLAPNWNLKSSRRTAGSAQMTVTHEDSTLVDTPIFPRTPPTNSTQSRDNRFFEVQLSPADGTELNAADLETAIADVIRQVDTHQGILFGSLTSENRDT
ncbi:hypothetical protein EDB89DRAFT_860148 [Lactarius sanguifluus]|nr:hypothetical protein EDB89DRAFT_860148 [Lactarius sanguifluus]